MQRPDGFTGCGTALVTPFTADGRLDEEALGALVELQIEEGIDFLVPCGTTGETPSLSRAELLRVVDVVVARSRGRVPVVAGAGGNCTENVIALARELAAAGVDGLLSVTPYYNKPTQEGLYRHYARLAEAVELPIILYNVPGRTGVNLAPDTVMRLAALDHVCGVKEASGQIAQITEIAIRKPAGFRLLSGDDGLVLPLIALGGDGVISVVANVAPRWMSEFTRLCLAGSFAAAREHLGRLDELARACFLETNPIPVKAALALLGRIRETYRLPMVPMSPEPRKRLERVLRETGLLAAPVEAGPVEAGARV